MISCIKATKMETFKGVKFSCSKPFLASTTGESKLNSRQTALGSLVDRRFTTLVACVTLALYKKCLFYFSLLLHGMSPHHSQHPTTFRSCEQQRVSEPPLCTRTTMAGKDSHSKEHGDAEPWTYRCGNLICIRNPHQVCCLGLEHTCQAVDHPGSCRLCSVFTMKSLHR